MKPKERAEKYADRFKWTTAGRPMHGLISTVSIPGVWLAGYRAGLAAARRRQTRKPRKG